ncbi:MAG: hypothetical protein K2Q01_02440 [Rickettsiales bacterium]|nr:hypothetical protein [Rickettsiales bacterium]
MIQRVEEPQNQPPKETRRHAGHSLALDAPSIASSTSDPITTTEDKDKFVSAGQKVHKWGTYLSVDWLFNTVTGVSFAYAAKYTDIGKKYWSGPITNGFKAILSPIIKHPETLARSAGYGNMFMSIIAGGMFTIPPLMVLENNKNKRAITEWADKQIYGKKAVEEDPRFKAFYEEIEHEPKKDFTSGLTSRFAALAPLLGMVLIPTTKRVADKVWFNHVEHASEVAFKKVGYNAENMFSKVSPTEAKERWKFIHESVAMDFGLGVPYAILHSVFYNKFAGDKAKGDGKADLKTAPQTAAQPAPEQKPEKQWAADMEKKTPEKPIEKKERVPTLSLAHGFVKRLDAEPATTAEPQRT